MTLAFEPRTPRHGSRQVLLAALAVAVVAWLAFLPTGSFAFVSYDDDVYVTRNPLVQGGLTLETVGIVLREPLAANYHPLTWLSHMLDVELFGLDAGAHHRVNAFLHATTAGLLVLALATLVGREVSLVPAIVTACVFALHPLRAESVAWVAERKDLMAGLFWVLTLLAYARHAARPSALRMSVVCLCFALGLLAKPMGVTLPFVLLLLDHWPLRRVEGWDRRVLEKLPLFGLCAASIGLTLWAQRAGGALDVLEALPFADRAANAFAALAHYVGDTLVPRDLAVFYPHPAMFEDASSVWRAATWVGLVLVVGATALGFRLRHRLPAVWIGWLWFAGTLVPVLGLVQVGMQSHADRYTYLPGIGLVLAVAYGLEAWTRSRPAARRVAAVLGLLWPLVLLWPLQRQLATWSDSASLYTRALEVTDRNYVAHANLGELRHAEGDLVGAERHYRAAVEARPGMALVHYQLGSLLAGTGRLQEAVDELGVALEQPEPRSGTEPAWHAARVLRGIVCSRLGRDAEARALLEAVFASEDTPRNEKLAAGQALAWLLATSPDDDVREPRQARAVVHALLEHVDTPQLREASAAAFAALGRFAEAVREQELALGRIPAPHRAGPEARLALYRAQRPFRKEPER